MLYLPFLHSLEFLDLKQPGYTLQPTWIQIKVTIVILNLQILAKPKRDSQGKRHKPASKSNMDWDLQSSRLYKLQMGQQMFGVQIVDLIQSGKYPLRLYVLLHDLLCSCKPRLSCLSSLMEDQIGEYVDSWNLEIALG